LAYTRISDSRIVVSCDTYWTEGKSVPEVSAVASSRQIRAPMTKAEWEKQQSVIRRVHDPITGRDRSLLLYYSVCKLLLSVSE